MVAVNDGGQGHGGGACDQNLSNLKTLAHAREGGGRDRASDGRRMAR